MVMGVKDRILEFLKYKDVSITKAESLLCWSKGALLKSNSISSDRLGEFYLQFPEVSPEWLLTGNGKMTKQAADQEAPVSSNNSDMESAFLKKEAFYLRQMNERLDELIEANETIENLKEEVESLKKRLELAEQGSSKMSVTAVKHKLG
jgi:hypothetical protein